MNKKKGFTLVELIVCIAILALVILVSIVVIKNNDGTNNNLEDEKELENSIEVLSDELSTKNNLVIYEDSEDIKNSFFCLKKNTIIDYGLISSDNEVLKNMSDDEYIRVEQDEVGKYIINTSASIDDCKYLKGTVGSAISDSFVDGDLKNDGYSLEHQVISSDRDRQNEFIYIVDFDLVTGDLIERKMNVYTVFILDGSSSMGKTGFGIARDAAINLSENLIASNTSNIKNYVSAISFSGVCSKVYDTNAITQEIPFKGSKLLEADFSYAANCTHYHEALEAGYNKINNITKNNNEDYMYFVIFLTDGINTGIDYTTPMNNIKTFLNNNESEKGKLVVVGYNYSGRQDILVNISSSGCIGSIDKCFYSTSSSDVINTFNEFYKLIQNEINCYYDKATISIELAENFYSYESDPKFINKELNLSCDGTGYNEEISKYVSDLFSGQEYIYFKKNVEENSIPGTYEFDIIKEIKVTLYKKNESTNEEVQVGSPIIISGDNFSSVSLNIEHVEVIN